MTTSMTFAVGHAKPSVRRSPVKPSECWSVLDVLWLAFVLLLRWQTDFMVGQLGRLSRVPWVMTAPLRRHRTCAMKALDFIRTRAAAERCNGSGHSTDAHDDQQEDDHHGFPSVRPPNSVSLGYQPHT